ncbi:CocE/NonD family hydrolase [Streptomyces flaveus]|uniref:CocE/NonD family hydrolase n=1 Tax=Streptomyces flaveus TaxID=66370 RepID=UPI003D9E69CE
MRSVARATPVLVTALTLAGTLTGPAAAASGTASEPAATAQKPAGGPATATDGVTHEENDRVPEGSVWTQHYFPSSDGSGTELHADVLLPEKLPKGERVPVILSAGAYFGHSGEISPEGWKHTGPSDRFQDFIEGTDLFDQGYAFVMVDTRGFGGTSAKRAPATSGKAGGISSSYFVRSEPLQQTTRITGTPRVSMTAKGEGNVMVKLYDVAKDGTAVMFDEQVSRLDSDRLAFDLKSTDWTLKAGHNLAVEIGSVQTGDWLDTPSQQKVKIKDARLELALDDPADDVATGGERSPYLDTYLSQYTVQLPAGTGTFTVPPARDHR